MLHNIPHSPKYSKLEIIKNMKIYKINLSNDIKIKDKVEFSKISNKKK